jgi:hypothetical protein
MMFLNTIWYSSKTDFFADVDSFEDAVARGDADKYSFPTLKEATVFAVSKIEDLTNRGNEILNRLKGAEETTQRIKPRSISANSQRRKRA